MKKMVSLKFIGPLSIVPDLTESPLAPLEHASKPNGEGWRGKRAAIEWGTLYAALRTAAFQPQGSKGWKGSCQWKEHGSFMRVDPRHHMFGQFIILFNKFDLRNSPGFYVFMGSFIMFNFQRIPLVVVNASCATCSLRESHWFLNWINFLIFILLSVSYSFNV